MWNTGFGLAVKCEHTEVSYDTVDWRPFLVGATCPMEEDGLARGLIQDPEDICGSHSLPYNEGGGGTASTCGRSPRAALAVVVLAQVVEGRRRSSPRSTPRSSASARSRRTAIDERGGQLDLFAAPSGAPGIVACCTAKAPGTAADCTIERTTIDVAGLPLPAGARAPAWTPNASWRGCGAVAVASGRARARVLICRPARSS